MKLLIFLALNTFCTTAAMAQSYWTCILNAEINAYHKNYKQSEREFINAFKIKQGSPKNFYDAALVCLKNGDDRQALFYLGKTASTGYIDLTDFISDSTFMPLRNSRKLTNNYSKLISRLNITEKHFNQPLRIKLLKIREIDQSIRISYISSLKDTSRTGKKVTDSLQKLMLNRDSLDLLEIADVLKNYGWPSMKEVGKKANQTVFLVIQHNPDVQNMYLKVMKSAVKNRLAEQSDFCYLIDRVAVFDKRLQIYGTQVGYFPDNNQVYVLPITNPEELDKRRIMCDLSPMEEYLNYFGGRWSLQWYYSLLSKVKKLNMMN